LATKTITNLVDDVDGSDADESIEFGLDGVIYEIDLSEQNAEALREALADWVNSARRTGGRKSAPTRTASVRTVLPAQKHPLGPAERHAIQRFAKQAGLKPPKERGRISATVLDAWEEAGMPM
jgi:hypothetical protein